MQEPDSAEQPRPGPAGCSADTLSPQARALGLLADLLHCSAGTHTRFEDGSDVADASPPVLREDAGQLALDVRAELAQLEISEISSDQGRQVPEQALLDTARSGTLNPKS